MTLRPAVTAALGRWGEVAVAGCLTAAFGWLAWRGAGGGIGALMAAAALGCAVWLRAAAAGALAARPVAPGPGMVVLREGEIGYMGPFRGGFIEIADLERVEIFVVSQGDEPVWRLVAHSRDLAIPAGADGAGGLPAALAALPGFSDLGAATALAARRAGRQVLWQRPGVRAAARLPGGG